MTNEITFIVPGQDRASALPPVRGQRRQSVQVGARRGAGDTVRVTARVGEDVVALTIANGPTLYLHPETARDLMRSQATGATRSAGAGGDGDAGGDVAVPAELGWPGLEGGTDAVATRGWLGRVLLSAVEVLTGVGTGDAADIATSAITRKVDGKVDAGVYRLSADELAPLKDSGRRLDSVPAAPGGEPMLVLLHGTFVDTTNTFTKLWTLHAPTVQRLFDGYGGRIYALDHPTLGESPIANALTLVNALPEGARLHLLTHSRGGLVAEVLARAASGVAPSEMALFADANGRDYSRHRADLAALADAMATRRIRVERVVRVACPARGTLLASNRLDAYLSVLKWALELAKLPVAPELVDFLSEVARRRADPAMLPGLEAMTPDSPVVKWLNGEGLDAAGVASRPPAIPGQLRVVAGDMEGDSLVSWLKTLLSDAFYWTDNDLVVQTRSMYGGSPRADEGASFLLDRGGEVNHFNYFANARTVDAIADALLNERPADFRLIGPLSWRGEDASGTRAGLAVARSRSTRGGLPATDRPAVFVLPGILGSNLALDGQRVWLATRFVNGLKDLAWDPAQAQRVTDDGPIGAVYDDLVEFLADSHEVFPFGYDWRRPLEDEAKRLARKVADALDARNGSQQPVRIVAHSMGGLLARTMRLEAPEVWQRLMSRAGARLLMLGTPNGGSWAPMQTLSGDDTFGNALAALGGLFDNAGTRRVMAGMPGFLQLQAALTDPALGLDRESRWQQIVDDDKKALAERRMWHDNPTQLAVYDWSAPPQAVLDQAVALRRRLDAQIDDLRGDAPKLLLVVGRARRTPAGISMGPDGLEYLDASDGDGRVTLDSAMLPGVRTWKTDVSHGELPSQRSAFDAYLELLQAGGTERLPVQPPLSSLRSAGDAAAAGPTLVPSRPSRARRPSEPPSLASDLFTSADRGRAVPTGARRALAVGVLNGNLKFCGGPLMVGHYAATTLTGTEAVVDRLIGGAMAESLEAGLYPTGIGSHQVFVNSRSDPEQPLAMPRPNSVVVVGLGPEGELRMSGLSRSVRQAVIAFAQRESERGAGGPTGFELSATLVGSGGTGVSPGGAAQAIAAGVHDANDQLQRVGWPQVTRLELVELYLDRATEAHKALSALSDAHPSQYQVAPAIDSGTAPLRRPLDASYRGDGNDFISAVQRFDRNREAVIEFTLDTQRARSEVRGQSAQTALVDELVRVGANSDSTDTRIRRSLFRLLVPLEIEPFLAGSNAMLLQLDSSTARFPWELLDPGNADDPGERYPWAVRTKLLRKLRTEVFREQPAGSGSAGGMLVIGEPQCPPDRFGPLPAARSEAEAVARALGVSALLGPDALSTIKALLSEPWRIVHIAGHGDLFEGEGGSRMGGVVLSSGMLLGSREIQAMRTVPDLVFVNCCFIGGIAPEAPKNDPSTPASAAPGYSRASFAASVAEELIRIGVRCVVAAGWAVEDGPAMIFARTFYQQLLSGQRFIDAVGAARLAAFDARPEGNTWAAYQCYGDPDWCLTPDATPDSRSTPDTPIVSAPALALVLETAALDAQYKDSGPGAKDARRRRLEWIRQLEARHATRWGDAGAVAEAFGLAYSHHDELDAAIRWYGRALQAADGSASFRSAEQLGNLLARRGLKQSDPKAAARDIAEGISRLKSLVALQPSAERESLLGSAYKQRTRLLESQGDADGARAALAESAAHYGAAEVLARRAGADNLYYPAMNAFGAELRLAFLEARAPAIGADRIAEARRSIEAKARSDPDFWSLAGVSELLLIEALAAGAVEAALPGVLAGLRDLKLRVTAVWLWDSVLNQARYTVEPYLGVAGRAEKAAAQRLLRELQALAGG